MENSLPPIPAKRYFTISEVGDLCGVKPHVLRYWEQEFTQLRPMKRSGNRRYYQHNEVLMIRRIRELLYDQGFTIHGARNQMHELGLAHRGQKRGNGAIDMPEFEHTLSDMAPEDADLRDDALEAALVAVIADSGRQASNGHNNGQGNGHSNGHAAANNFKWQFVRQELNEIRELLGAVPQTMRV
jgi:DNA-binding transcriptional MerR regulator